VTADAYEILAVRYAHVERRASENFIGGDPHDGPMPMDYFVWVVRNSARTIVVDTGFDERGAIKRKRTITLPVLEGLKSIGVDHETIEDVIYTHMHYDHAGNTALFPRARFHVQDREMQFATGRCMCHPTLSVHYEVEDVVTMVRRTFAGRVKFHDGEAEFAPGITLHHVGGHSNGMQVVRVKTKRGFVVLASDAAHYYANIEQRRIFPAVTDIAALLEGYDSVERLASSRSHIIPGHDPLVLSRYPAISDNLQGVVCRLDVPPEIS
jgi:glyoxylase-like metal-dependent hydrolase (beta-lactamase superfamily II)